MTATPHEVDCYGCGSYDCEHHIHVFTESGDCYEYCDVCAAQLAKDGEEIRAEWEQWKAGGQSLGLLANTVTPDCNGDTA